MNSKRETALVLLSSGLDSSFNLAKSVSVFEVKLALTFNYGQKAARAEIRSAELLARHYKVPHQIVDLPWFSDFTTTSLIGEAEVPQGHEVEIDSLEKSNQTAERVWVPNRNGIFLNIAAGFAEGIGARYVIPGFNREEAATFPDNSLAYLKSLDQSWSFSTLGKVQTFCHSTDLDKTEIVQEAEKLGLPFATLWPCYLNESQWCGRCESCQRFRRALEANGLSFEALKTQSPWTSGRE